MSETCVLSYASSSSHPPPWEVLFLVSRFVDPKTLAMAYCVCKSWSISMSSDHLWKLICFTHYPSLSLADPTVSYRRLYALAHQSTKRRHPSPPRISLNDLIFAVDIFYYSSRSLSLANAGKDLDTHWHGVFRFDVDVQSGDVAALEMSTEVKVTWAVVLKGWRGVFSMMECKGKGRLVPGGEQWFTEELPSPGVLPERRTKWVSCRIRFRVL